MRAAFASVAAESVHHVLFSELFLGHAGTRQFTNIKLSSCDVQLGEKTNKSAVVTDRLEFSCQEAALQNLQSCSSLLQLWEARGMLFSWFPTTAPGEAKQLAQPVSITPPLPAPHPQVDLQLFR